MAVSTSITGFSGVSAHVGLSGYPGASGASLINVNQAEYDNIQVSIPMEEIRKISEGNDNERIKDEVISIISERIADDIMDEKEKEMKMLADNIDISALLERVKEELVSQIKDKIVDDIK